MTLDDSTLDSLREALKASPNNVPLRRLLGDALQQRQQFDEAVAEYRRGLKVDPAHAGTKLSLARCYLAQGKNGAAVVVVEDLLNDNAGYAAAHVVHAKALVATGEIEKAVKAYREALSLDPAIADNDLADRLGVTDAPSAPDNTDMNEVVDGRVRAQAGDLFDDLPDEDDPEDLPELARPAIDFASVGGMDAVKEEVRMKIIHPLSNRDLYAAYGKTIGGGILLYGPPGCGKTHLARATAGEIKAGFLSVGLHDVLDMWIGQSEQKLHQIFQQARRNTPSVLFFDEVDALAASRSDMRRSAGRHLINQFLSELDGANESNEGVLVLAATNAPWHLDSAFRRPGRFDRIIFVPPPDEPARAAILEILLAGKPVDSIDAAKIAKKTDGFSGADLKAAVDAAVEAALTEAMKRGKPVPLTTRGLLAAAKTVKPSTRDWFATARNHALYANEGGLYDDIVKYLDMK